MKAKTILELLTLSSGLYLYAKDTELMDRIKKMSDKGKASLNKVVSETQLDDDGNELELIDKIILKTSQFKEELEHKVDELVIEFYKKVNIAHLDEIKVLNEKLEQSDMAMALLEARLNKLETKK